MISFGVRGKAPKGIDIHPMGSKFGEYDPPAACSPSAAICQH